jgi:enoyl-CoA hydratase
MPAVNVPTLTEKLVATKEDGIGWIRFNNPERRNAVTFEMWQSIPMVLEDFANDVDVRVVILRGTGDKAFVAGADISQFKERRTGDAAVKEYNANSERAGDALRGFPKPTIAMIRGYCIGGGTATAANCDLRIAAEDARFGVPAGRLGLGYRFSGIRRLAAVVGPAAVAEIMFTARQFSAQEALQMSLVNRVVPVDELEKVTLQTAAMIAANAPLTMQSVKRSLAELLKDPDQRDIALCNGLVEKCFKSEDYQEGQKAFMEKRKPVFKGR